MSPEGLLSTIMACNSHSIYKLLMCWQTGYKPIFEAARTFVVEDLNGVIVESNDNADRNTAANPQSDGDVDGILRTANKLGSCGRPGGCCRDDKASGCGSMPNAEIDRSSKSMETPITSNSLDNIATGESFVPYKPSAELIFPPSLWKYEPRPICYGDERRLWFRPTTLQQLVDFKAAYPSAKIVGGASETQIEVRFKKMDYQISVFAADIAELNMYKDPGHQTQADLKALNEVCIPGNMTLTKVEYLCKDLFQKLGSRAFALEALRKQLRYFAGRQIRNVASLAGSLATASPISDSAPVLLAARARVIVKSQSKGTLDIPLDSWFTGYRKTALPEDGVITQIVIPLPREGVREVTKTYKQAKRKDDDIAIVTAGFRVRLDQEGFVENCCFSFGGMGPTTVMAVKAQETVSGKRWADATTLEAATDALLQEFNLGYGVPGGMPQYRRGCLFPLLKFLIRKANLANSANNFHVLPILARGNTRTRPCQGR